MVLDFEAEYFQHYFEVAAVAAVAAVVAVVVAAVAVVVAYLELVIQPKIPGNERVDLY